MVNNCVSSCAPSIAMSHTSFKCLELCPEPHLSLRNKIYYCRMELPATNGKRNVLRFSLSTDNYYEASQMIKDIKQYLKNISRLDQLYKRLTLEKIYTNTNDSTNSSYIYVLSKDNDVELLKNIKSLYDDCMTNDLDDDLEDYKLDTQAQIISSQTDIKNVERFNPWSVDGGKVWKRCLCNVAYIKKVLDKVGKIIVQIQNILYPQDMIPSQVQSLPQTSPQPLSVQNISVTPSIPHHTIQEVLDRLAIDLKHNVGKETAERKFAAIKKILFGMGISLDDDYNKLNNKKIINEIESNIKGIDKLGAKAINHRILSMNEFIKSANKLEPDYYQLYQLENIPIKKGMASKISKTYLPYTQEELVQMFDPEYKIFKKHPDIFWACMIALYCGARTNGATTLRYTDIVDQGGIKCFDFKLDDDSDVEDPDYDPFKKLKNAATVRVVPIHSRLIELGFLDYIYKYEKRNAERFQNFIFKRTISFTKEKKEQIYKKKFMDPLFRHLRKLKIKKDRWKAFHSFRTNINKALRDFGVEQTMRNSIIGWEGKTTPERNYSDNELREVQRELEKLHYDFLDEELNQIAKEILEKE